MKRKLIGHIAVDSGQIAIIDPCYVADDSLSYLEVLEATSSSDGYGSIMGTLALAFRTPLGDGWYPVYAEYDEDGMLIRVTIEMK
jgi:hypothetical protein